MFDGYGLALEERFFGIVQKGRLSFNTDPATAPRCRVHRQKPFKPNTRQTLRNYYEVPVDIVDSADILVKWAVAAAPR